MTIWLHSMTATDPSRRRSRMTAQAEAAAPNTPAGARRPARRRRLLPGFRRLVIQGADPSGLNRRSTRAAGPAAQARPGVGRWDGEAIPRGTPLFSAPR